MSISPTQIRELYAIESLGLLVFASFAGFTEFLYFKRHTWQNTRYIKAILALSAIILIFGFIVIMGLVPFEFQIYELCHSSHYFFTEISLQVGILVLLTMVVGIEFIYLALAILFFGRSRNIGAQCTEPESYSLALSFLYAVMFVLYEEKIHFTKSFQIVPIAYSVVHVGILILISLNFIQPIPNHHFTVASFLIILWWGAAQFRGEKKPI